MSWLVAVAIGVPAVYLVLGNLLLAHVLARLDRSPSMAFAYESASTSWPGRAHLSELRISRTAGLPASIAFETVELELDVLALARAGLRGPRVQVDALDASVVELVLDDVRVQGRMRLQLASLAVGGDGEPRLGAGALALRDATVSHRGDVVLQGVEGRVALDGAARWTWPRVLEHAGTVVELGGEVPAGPTLVGASELVLAEGGTFALGLGDRGGLEAVVEAPSLRIHAAVGAIEAHDARLELDLAAGEGPLPELVTTRARWRASDVQLHTGAGRARGAMRGDLTLQPGALGDGLAAAGARGHLALDDLNVDRDGRRAPPIDLDLAIEELRIETGRGVTLRGALEGRGDDAVALLDILGAPPGVRLALDAIHGRSLSLQAQVDWADGELDVPALSVASGPFWARGAYAWSSRAERLVLLAGYGQLTVGVSRDGTSWSTRIEPPPEWLAERTFRVVGDG